MKLRTIFIAAACLMSGAAAQAQDNNTYSGKEQWYLQAQGGANIQFVEYDHGKSAGAAVSFAVGKNITPVWGARVQMIWGADKSQTSLNSAYYTFKHNSAYVVGTFNLTNAIRGTKVGEECKWNLDLIAGPGLIHSYGFAGEVTNKVNTNSHVSPALLAGIATSYAFSEHWGINLEVTGNAQHESFNGIVVRRYLEGNLNILAGVRYNF